MPTQTHQVLSLLVERKISLDETERLLDLVNSGKSASRHYVERLLANPEMAGGVFDRQSINKLIPRIDMGNIYPYV